VNRAKRTAAKASGRSNMMQLAEAVLAVVVTFAFIRILMWLGQLFDEMHK